MIFVKTFKGYEDKVQDLDRVVNEWIAGNQVQVRSIQTALSHEVEGRHSSGDLIYTVVYDAAAPIS
jgi:hypothetical protein